MLGSLTRGQIRPDPCALPLWSILDQPAGSAALMGSAQRKIPALCYRAIRARPGNFPSGMFRLKQIMSNRLPFYPSQPQGDLTVWNACGMAPLTIRLSSDTFSLSAPLRAALCPICRHEPRRPRALSPGHSRTAHARRTKPLLDRAAWCPPLSPRFCRGPEFRACLAARLEKIQCQRAC